MAFELENVVPWGRNLDEYKLMFNLTYGDLKKSIVSFGDGPSSFHTEMTSQGYSVTSIDPIYHFTAAQIQQRINETKDEIVLQVKNNQDNFVWDHFEHVDELVLSRMAAMGSFLEDFEEGKKENRYIAHALPDRTIFEDKGFDLGLSSHFLILYSQLGIDFHIQSIEEMLRICKEVRIFPLLNLDAKDSEVLQPVLDHFQDECFITIEQVHYEFQKGGNKMLKLRKGKKTILGIK